MLLTRFIVVVSLYLIVIAADVDDVHDRIADGVVTQLSNDKGKNMPLQSINY